MVDNKQDSSKKESKVKEEKVLTTKEIKALARPEFEKYPERFYPVETFKKLGFSRNQCPKCQHFYWRRTEKRETCGDSKYEFIGRGCGIGRTGKKITYADAWKGFERSLTSARIPCTSIERYPVVARWRADVDYVAAGIYCFQPYCVTGELDPPANPLICPQFCVRFNDLDNIGLTGRHYSGFIMLGIQVFNYPNKYTFFKDECVEFNYRWLTEELGIDADEITFIEDVWAGGGNLGPSIEYFINGLELGNMVFMQYKTFHDGSREELPIKIIDTGIGLERVAWLVNGSATSYMDTFKHAVNYFSGAVGIELNNEVWEKFGPFSSRLNVDEVDDIDKTWQMISKEINVDVEVVKKSIGPVKDMYIILDHIRTVFMIIYDGSLPSNVGGGSNVRNILRRVFALLHKNGWWEKLKVKGLMELIENHQKDLKEIFGEFKKHENMEEIIALEYEKWLTTDAEQKVRLEKELKKKNGKLSIDDWIMAMESWGIPADRIAQIAKCEIPGNLYAEIALRKERQAAQKPEQMIYDTTHLPETVCLYYNDHTLEFTGKVIEVWVNLLEGEMKNKRNIVILDRSAFYPTSGGQEHDTGVLVVNNETYNVVKVEKVGKCTLHLLDREIPSEVKGASVTGRVNGERRHQLMSHHTGTHIVFAAARKVLGPHVWQNGAKKTLEGAHLDITHYKSLTLQEELEIENEANRIIMRGLNISKSFMDKSEAEKKYGFVLYQGGVVPGNNLRVVQIEDTDVEACCGTHCDRTSEVGWVKMIKSTRIQDGIIRLYYVAYEKALSELNNEKKIIEDLCLDWGVEKDMITKTANRFFKEFKHYSGKCSEQDKKLIKFQTQLLVFNPNWKFGFVKSDQDNFGIYKSNLANHYEELVTAQKGIIFYNQNFIYGFLGTNSIPAETFIKHLEETKEGQVLKYQITTSVKHESETLQNVLYICSVQKVNIPKFEEFLKSVGFVDIEGSGDKKDKKKKGKK